MAFEDSDTKAVVTSSNTKKVTSAASTNATLIAAGGRKVVGGELSNVAAYDVFLKFYDKATAPTPGTDTPVLTVKIPTGGAPVPLSALTDGMKFTLGLGYAITKLIAVSDTTVIAAGDVQGAIIWA